MEENMRVIVRKVKEQSNGKSLIIITGLPFSRTLDREGKPSRSLSNSSAEEFEILVYGNYSVKDIIPFDELMKNVVSTPTAFIKVI